MQCFCGCGRKVSFSKRPINTSGRRVTEALEHITNNARPLLEATETTADLDGFQEAGEEFQDQLAEIVHGDRSGRDFDRASMRWWLRTAWRSETDAEVGAALLEEDDPGEEELPDDPEEAAEKLLGSMTRLTQFDFDSEVEQVLAIGAMTLCEDVEDEIAISLARLGFTLRALERVHVEDPSLEITGAANYAVATALDNEMNEEEAFEQVLARACLSLAMQDEDSPAAAAHVARGFDPEFRRLVRQKWLDLYTNEPSDDFRATFDFGYVVALALEVLRSIDGASSA